jgi:PAS domain S-box-containing protein/diguanylate cyclase (GGDEF)-like protein
MAISLRVLIVTEVDGENPLLAALGRGGYESVWASAHGAGEMRAALERADWEIVIVSDGVSDLHSLDALNIARGHDPDLPLVFIDDVASGDVALETIKCGAHDYVSRCSPGRLPAVVERELREAQARREQRRAASALYESEARFRSIFEQAAVGMVQTTVDGRFVEVNATMCRFLGYAKDELLAMTFKQLTHPDDLRQNLDLREKLQKGEIDRYTHEKRYVRKDGTEVWGRVTVANVNYASGGAKYTVAVVEDITERRRAEEALLKSEEHVAHLGHYDRVTDLPNRELFHDRLQQALAQASRNGWIAAVVCIELSRFSMVKDALGYAATDKLLQEIARRLCGCVRAADTVSRLGEQQFALILSNLEVNEDAAVVAQRVLDAVAAPVNFDGKELLVSAYVGIALYPADNADLDKLVQNAGNAMQNARNCGSSGYLFYSAEMNAQAARKLDLENSLRLALERNEFVLYYQPKVDLISGEIKGVEALLRWRRDGNLICPGEFIPMLEESGLIVAVGEWTLRQACAQLHAWRTAGLPAITMAVNLSARQLYQKGLPEIIQSILKSAGIEPGLLELELTESSLISGAAEAEQLLRKISAMGVHLSLDDFGTGYSSLSYLKSFPIDTVKIDRSFITDITSDPDDASITRAVITLAHNLNLKVVAEGVETEAQTEYLAANHCDEIQGYYFSRPLPDDECTALLRNPKSLLRHARKAIADERTLLLVDDEQNIQTALKRLLRRDGYRILTASSAAEGLQLLAINDVSVIVSDQRMPEMTGVEFLSRVKDIHPNTVRMVLSGYSDLQTIADAINRGAIYRFLSKPWDDEELRANIRAAFRHAVLVRENDALNHKLNFANDQLVHANQELRQMLGEKSRLMEHDEILLNIAQESMQYIPLPVLGIDDDGLVAFANTRAETVLGKGMPLLGSFADEALPQALAGCLAATAAGELGLVDVDGQCFEVMCHLLGRASRSRGRLVVLVPRGTLQ